VALVDQVRVTSADLAQRIIERWRTAVACIVARAPELDVTDHRRSTSNDPASSG
jgi:hypothetical protein